MEAENTRHHRSLEEFVKILLAMPFTARTLEDNLTKLDARRKLGAKKLA